MFENESENLFLLKIIIENDERFYNLNIDYKFLRQLLIKNEKETLQLLYCGIKNFKQG